MQFEIGDVVKGRVSTITSFGAFLSFEGGTGLVHISEISTSYVKDIHDFLKVGEEVEAKIITIDANGKIGLSVKKLQQERAKKPSMSSPAEYFKAPAPKDQSFEDMMTRFKSISDDKMSDLKRGKDFKRRSSRNSSQSEAAAGRLRPALRLRRVRAGDACVRHPA